MKTNMKENYTNYNCDECKIIGRINEDNQEHLLDYPVINASKVFKESDYIYSDIFAMNVNKQINITKEIMENMHIREAFKKTT